MLFRQLKHGTQWQYWKTQWTPHYNSSFIVHNLYSFLFNLCKLNVTLHLLTKINECIIAFTPEDDQWESWYNDLQNAVDPIQVNSEYE